MNNGRLPDDIDENYYRSLEFINSFHTDYQKYGHPISQRLGCYHLL